MKFTLTASVKGLDSVPLRKVPEFQILVKTMQKNRPQCPFTEFQDEFLMNAVWLELK